MYESTTVKLHIYNILQTKYLGIQGLSLLSSNFARDSRAGQPAVCPYAERHGLCGSAHDHFHPGDVPKRGRWTLGLGWVQQPWRRQKIEQDFHGFSWIFVDFHGFSWIFMDFHGFSKFLLINIIVIHFSIFVILCWGCWGHYKPEGQLTSSALAARTLLVSWEGPTCQLQSWVWYRYRMI